MVMESGDLKIQVKDIKANIVWIKNQDTVFMSGKMVGLIKEIFRMI